MVADPRETQDKGITQLSPRGERIANAVRFFTAAKNRFKEGGAIEDVLDVLSQAKTLGAEFIETDQSTALNIITRAQALELAFTAKLNGATGEEIKEIFEMFELNPEEI